MKCLTFPAGKPLCRAQTGVITMTIPNNLQFEIPDMDCKSCVASIERAVHKIDADAAVTADLTSKQVVIGSHASAQDMIAAIQKAGFEVKAAAG